MAMVPALQEPRRRLLSEGDSGAVKLFAAIEEDTVTESGQAGWVEVSLHLVTIMFGAGVLGLPYALASLGWVLGLCVLALATGASAYSAFLLAELHTLRDGRRVRTLRALGEEVWGRRGRRWIMALQLTDMVGGVLIYTVVGGASLAAIAGGCWRGNGATCDSQDSLLPWTLCFSAAVVALSQFKDFQALTVVSLLGAVMPLVYAGVAFVSVLAYTGAPQPDYTIVQQGGALGTAMSVLSGIGAMHYAFGGQVVQNEVTATVRTPPSVLHSMRKALAATYLVIGVCYFGVAIAGYAVFGNAVAGNILQSIPHRGPAIVANIAVLLHVGAACPAFSMTVYELLEEQAAQRKLLPPPIACRPWLTRLVVRTAYVCAITFAALKVPYFNQLSGLKGGACMVPLCFVAPIALWTSYNRGYGVSRLRLTLNYALIALLGCIALAATVGSVYQLLESASVGKALACTAALPPKA